MHHARARPRRVKLQEELRVVERAKNDKELEESFVHDKYKQIKAENERLLGEIAKYRSRLGNATEDYVSRAQGAGRGGTEACRGWA